MDQQLQNLESLDPSKVSSTKRYLEIFDQVTLRFRAYELLQDALKLEPTTEIPRFKLQRLATLLEYIFGKGNEPVRRGNQLGKLELIPFIIIGLSIPMKELNRMDGSLFEEVIRQCEEAAPRLSPVILGDQIKTIIYRSSAASFILGKSHLFCDTGRANKTRTGPIAAAQAWGTNT